MGTFRPGWLSCLTATVTSVPCLGPSPVKWELSGGASGLGQLGLSALQFQARACWKVNPLLCPKTLPLGHQMRVGDAAWCGVQVRAELLPSALRTFLWWPAGSSLSCSVFAVVGATIWLVQCRLSEGLCHSCWGWAVVVGSPPSAPSPLHSCPRWPGVASAGSPM